MRFLFKTFLALFLTFILFWIAAWGFLQTDRGRQWAVDAMIQFVENHTETHFSADHIEIFFPLGFRAENVSISEKGRQIAAADELEVFCDYWQLLEGRLIFSSVEARNLNLLALPSRQGQGDGGFQFQGKALIPFYVKIEKISFKNIWLKPSVIQAISLPQNFAKLAEHSRFNLKGSVTNNPFNNTLSSQLFIELNDENKGAADFRLSLANRHLSFSFHAKKISRQFELGDERANFDAAIALSAAGPLNSWLNILETGGKDSPIEGNFKIIASPKNEKILTLTGHEIIMKGKYSLQPGLLLGIEHFQLACPGINLRIKETALSAAHAENQIKGFIKILFDYEEIPCDFASSFQWNPQQLFLEDLKGTFFDATAIGNLSFTFKDPLWNGHLEIHSGNFQKLSSFLGTPFEGNGSAIISLTPFPDENGIKHQRIESDITAQGLRWDNLSSKHLSAHFTVIAPKENQLSANVEAHLIAESLLFNDLSTARIALNATHQIDLKDLTISNLFTQMTAEKIEWAEGKADRGFFDINLYQPLLWNGKIRFAFEKIEAYSSLIEELQGETTLDLTQSLWPFELEGKGKWNENWAFNLNGQWHIKEDSFDLHFQKLSGFFEGASFFLLNPVALTRNAEKIVVSETHLKWGQAEIDAQFLIENQKIDLQFSTNSMNAALLNTFFPNFPIEGAASLKGFFRGSTENPFGEIQLALHELSVPENLGVKKTSLRGKVDLAINNSGIQIKSLLYGIGASPFRLYGTLPFQLTLSPFALHQSSAIPLSLNLEAEGEIDPFVDLFYNAPTHLTGHARIALNLTGQLDAPLIKGTVDLENGTYENINSGSIYQNIQARFEAEGTNVLLKHFSAENTHDGSVTATGTIELDKNKDFPFDFSIKPKKIFIVESEYANISASGPLRLSGNKKKSKLEGELTTDTAAIDLESALPKQIKSVDVQFINLQNGEEPLQPDTPKINSSIEFDIKLNLPNNLMVEGKKLTSRWKGGLMIAGTPKDPLLFGDLRVSEGEYKFNGKMFNLTQGTIHFSGLLSKKTSIYVVASKDIGKIKADIIVKGPTNKLTVSFRSTPPLSQREILSYILFNRGISDITPDQGDQLTQSFIALNETDSVGSDDFLTRLRNNIGLDRLDILPQSFQVGKYITEGVFVSIDKTKDLGNRLIIEADVLKNLKAQAEVRLGGESQQKFSLKWKKDY